MLDWRGTLLVAAACSLIGAWLALRIQAARARNRGRRSNQRGQRGEREAERLLEAHGYRIVARQLRTSYRIEIAESTRMIDLVLDFVVERQGEQLVAEVKTGNAASLLNQADTRRQLLEYQLATGSRRVLLVDPEHARISEISFPLSAPRGKTSPWATGALLAGLLLLAALIFLRYVRGL
jgi:Holliday junction resolvase-like predicted endonuclease